MFILKNAWKSVIRNKGRNILIIIIVTIIAAAATIGLSIRQAAEATRENGLANTTVSATIGLNRTKLIADLRSSDTATSNSGSTTNGSQPNFDSLRSALSNKQLTLADYTKYATASSAVKTTYYSESTPLNGTTSFQPVSTSSSSDSNTSSSGSSDTSNSPGNTSANSDGKNSAESGNTTGNTGGFPSENPFGGAFANNSRRTPADFTLTGFSSDKAIQAARNGAFTMSSGTVFGYDSSSNMQIIISKSLADFNNLSVGSTVTVNNTTNTTTTYQFTVVGIYTNVADSSNGFAGPSSSPATDPANAIYTSTSTINSLGLSSESGASDAATLTYTYVFSNKDNYETFVSDTKKAGLSSDYTVNSADVSEYEASLIPLNNLSSFALTLLLIVLGVGAIVLVALNLFNVRERKYEVGVLTAIGVEKSKVALQFVVELFIVTMIGLALGAAGGAVASVPVSNQLLTSQISAEQNAQTSQMQQFGRSMIGTGTGTGTYATPPNANENKSGTSSGNNNQPSASESNRISGNTSNNSPFGRATHYISSINATVNMPVVGQLILIGLALTIISGLVAVIFVTRYEPLQILADRS